MRSSYASSVVSNNNGTEDASVEPEQSTTENESKCKSSSLGPVYKSPLDRRKYKALQLPNGMKVVLISTLELKSDEEPKKTCHLKPLLKFNKTCLGLDSSMYRIRCDCQPGISLTAEKGTSTSSNKNATQRIASDGSVIKEEDSAISLTEALKAIKELLYGIEKDDIYNFDIPSDTSQTTNKSNKTTTTQPNTGLDEDEILNAAETQVASAYLCVGAGWFNDPTDMPGMAHFVEHSFFLGSRKFPYPNQIFRLILPHDGYTNAYTGGLQTMYTISTSLEIFALALEMLGDGVGFPLLPKDLVSKEIDALDAEYSLRIDDIPKYNQLLASLAKENHPLRKMDTGNKATLRVKGFYQKLVNWRAKHYCANYMTLALEAPIELEELEELATLYFSDIPSSKLPNPRNRIQTSGSPFENDKFHRIFLIPSIYHSEFFAIHWALEPQTWKNLSTKPLEYLGSLISHKGEGSLHQFLNYFGWATNVTAGSWDSDVFSNHFTSIFTIYVDLTEEGYLKQDLIVHAVFGYLEMLRMNEPSLAYFQEMQKQQADYFHHRAARNTTSYCEEVALWLQYVPAKFILVAPQLTTKFDPDIMKKCLNMLTVDDCNIMAFSKKYMLTESEKSAIDMENYYKTMYTTREFPEGFCDQIKHIAPQLSKVFSLPQPNPYLQEITCCGAQQKSLIRDGPLMVVEGKCSIYYKDTKFETLRGQLPQSKYVFWFHSPVMNGQKTEAMMELFSNFINEMIEAKFSSALSAHFHLHAKVTPGKLELSLTGPSSQLPKVTKDLFKILILFEKILDENTFNIGKQAYMDRMDNISLDNVSRAWEVVNFMWANNYQMSSEQVRQTEKISYSKFLEFVKSFKRKVYIAAHLHGFISVEQAFHIVQTVAGFTRIYPQIVKPQEIRGLQCPKLPVGESVVKLKSKNAKTHTSVVINGYQFGHLNKEDNKIVNFLAKCMSDIAYHKLRTLEQLGYIVLVYYDQVYSVTSMFLEVVTQPKNFSTEYCNQRMDQFILEFYTSFLSDETKFTHFLKGKPKVDFQFSRIQELYKRYLLPSQYFRKMSVQIVGTLLDAFIVTQKAHAAQPPLIYVPNMPEPIKNPIDISFLGKSKTKQGKGKSMQNIFKLKKEMSTAKNVVESGTDIRTTRSNTSSVRSRGGKKKNDKSKKLVRDYPKNNKTKREVRSKSTDASGDVNNSPANKEQQPVTRFVKDIYKFRNGLSLYPNPGSFRIDEDFYDDNDDSSISETD